VCGWATQLTNRVGKTSSRERVHLEQIGGNLKAWRKEIRDSKLHGGHSGKSTGYYRGKGEIRTKWERA